MANQRYRRIVLAILVFMGGYLALVCIAGQLALSPLGEALEIQPASVGEIYASMIAHGIAAALCAIGALHIRRQRTVGPRVPKVALLISLVLLIASCDRIVCVLFPPPWDRELIFMPHEERGWFHWPRMIGSGSGQRVETNSLGFRSSELPAAKAPDEVRALFIGDSITFGYCLKHEDTFVHMTESLLREACPTRVVHAMNGGVCGYETWQEFHLLRHEGMRSKPDIVILCYCLNDMTDLIGREPGVPEYPRVLYSLPNARDWSGIVRAIRSSLAKRRAARLGDRLQRGRTDAFLEQDPALKTWEDVYREPPVPIVREAWQGSLEELQKVNAFCQSEGLPWVLIYSPNEAQLGPNAVLDQPERRLSTWATENNVPYIDITKVYEKDMAATDRQPSDYLMDSVHPRVMGSRIMAETIVQFLKERRLPPFEKPDAS